MNTEIRSKLIILRRQYFQLVEPSQLSWPEDTILKHPDVQSWLFSHLFQAGRIAFPPPDRYRLRVLKVLTSKLEESIHDPEEDEISDDIMSELSSLLSSNIPAEPVSVQQKAFVTYAYSRLSIDGSDSEDSTVTLLECRSVISSSGTTGLRTWEAALLLGAFLVSESGRGIVDRKKVFEVGAGTGLLSILCAKHLEVSAIVATDGDEAIVDSIKTNIFLNKLDTDDPSRPIIRTAALKWGWPIDGTTFIEDYGMKVPDVLLGADVTYDQFVIPSLVSSLRQFFDLNSALQVLIAATVRNEQTFETFVNACKRNRFSLELVDYPPTPEQLQEGPFYPTSTPIQIWRITRLQPPEDPFAF